MSIHPYVVYSALGVWQYSACTGNCYNKTQQLSNICPRINVTLQVGLNPPLQMSAPILPPLYTNEQTQHTESLFLFLTLYLYYDYLHKVLISTNNILTKYQAHAQNN